jgi:hypothetical protein
VIPFVVWFLNTRVQPKARLVQGVRHASTLSINEPTVDQDGKVIAPIKIVHTASVSFVNTGRNPATNMQITFNWRPHHFNIWPNRHFTEQVAPDGRFTLALGALPPKEFIVIDLLAVAAALPAITSAFCDECAAKIVPLMPQEVHPRWKLLLFGWFVACGIGVSIYLLLAAIQFIATR